MSERARTVACIPELHALYLLGLFAQPQSGYVVIMSPTITAPYSWTVCDPFGDRCVHSDHSVVYVTRNPERPPLG